MKHIVKVQVIQIIVDEKEEIVIIIVSIRLWNHFQMTSYLSHQFLDLRFILVLKILCVSNDSSPVELEIKKIIINNNWLKTIPHDSKREINIP